MTLRKQKHSERILDTIIEAAKHMDKFPGKYYSHLNYIYKVHLREK